MVSRKGAKTQRALKLFASLRLCVIISTIPVVVFAAQDEKAPPTDFLPMQYFRDRCARCHGPEGAYYDLKHLAAVSDEKLHQVIGEMAEGPGQAPLTAEQIAIEAALHRSFLDEKPFVFANKPKRGDGKLVLSGEVSPDSKVSILLSKNSVVATVTDSTWQAIFPADGDFKNATIIATNGKARTELRVSDGYSHR